MKILIADKLSPNAVIKLEELGAKVTMNPDLGADDLPKAIKANEILVVRSTKVHESTMKAGKQLGLIIRAGAGVNTIDLKAASKRGIHVANCPGKNTDAVAELAIGLMIAADRQIVDASTDLRNGKWRKKVYGKAAGLKGRTLGILGLGSIGKAVAKRAAGLEMNVQAWSRSLTPEAAAELGVGYCKTPAALFSSSDVISIHAAATADTKHLVNAKLLSKVKEGAILINTSRGQLIDTKALKTAIIARNLRVGLDVFEDEPSSGEAAFEQTDLASLVGCTPHIGASTDQAAEAIAAEVVRIVEAYKATGKPINVVNMCAKSPAVTNLAVRHFNRVGVLATVLDALREEKINVEEVENSIFQGGEAALATLRLDDVPSKKLLKALGKNENIIHICLS